MTPETLRLQRKVSAQRSLRAANAAVEHGEPARAVELIHQALILLDAQPSDAGEREAFMAGHLAAQDQTDKFGETHETPEEAYAAWKAIPAAARPARALARSRR